MTLKVVARKYAPILLLICIPLLAGSQCAFIFSSGDNSNDDDEKEDIIVVASGNFGAVPVAGANYRSGSVSGVTGSSGEFEYEVDRQVQFFIGDIPLGRAVDPKAVITTLDLVDGGTVDSTEVINIERLLQSLDSEPGDNAITIPEKVRAKAVKTNEPVSSAIAYLDFSDDDAFANSASQLVAVLTEDYPFTGELVAAETARKALARSR